MSAPWHTLRGITNLSWPSEARIGLFPAIHGIALPPASRVIAQRLEHDAVVAFEVVDQPLQQEHTVSAADHLRVEGQRVQPPGTAPIGVVEIPFPDLLDRRRRRQTGVRAEDELEGRKVVEAPGDRQLDEPRRLAEDVRLVERPAVAAPQVVGKEVASHAARIVLEAVLEEQVHAARAQIPGRRAIATRPHAGDLVERVEPALEDAALTGRVEARRILVDPTVMDELVPLVADPA